jgi:hypothetical protein
VTTIGPLDFQKLILTYKSKHKIKNLRDGSWLGHLAGGANQYDQNMTGSEPGSILRIDFCPDKRGDLAVSKKNPILSGLAPAPGLFTNFPQNLSGLVAGLPYHYPGCRICFGNFIECPRHLSCLKVYWYQDRP